MKSSLFLFSLFVCFLNIVEGKVGENCFLGALVMTFSKTGDRQKLHYKGENDFYVWFTFISTKKDKDKALLSKNYIWKTLVTEEAIIKY